MNADKRLKDMYLKFDQNFAAELRARLDSHPIYGAVQTLADLRVFMQHHVYSVWDFMSLIKYLQHTIAPTRWPWRPSTDSNIQRFINELVLEEETDAAGPNNPGNFSSHFQLYIGAMREVGADVHVPLQFVDIAAREGMTAAFASGLAPEPARVFSQATFAFIDSNKPHAVAAALALGREHVIPGMFRAFLSRMAVNEAQAPIFHYYLQRHIHLDEDFHAPMSLRLMDALCEGNPAMFSEAREASVRAVQARIAFWDGVLKALPSQQKLEPAI